MLSSLKMENLIKQLWIIWLICLILMNGTMYSVIYVNYSINKTYVIEYLCENKSVPMTMCGGSCFLEKQYDTASNAGASGLDSIFPSFVSSFFIIQSDRWTILPIDVPHVVHTSLFIFSNYSCALCSVKKPPKTFSLLIV